MSAKRATPNASPRKRSALSLLGASELGAVLDGLLRARPELRPEAELIARGQLADTSQEAVAEELEWKLRSLSSAELHGHADRQRWGYVEPTEAAWDLLSESVEPYHREIERLRALGIITAAIETALGVVDALYRCRGRHDSELLLSWAPDFPVEEACSVVDGLAKAGIAVPPDRFDDAAPEWADAPSRALRASA